jgi:DNA-binding transcriptional MerR regulator
MMNKDNSEPTYSSDELCTLADVPKRTLRYYIQQGLLQKPIGETRSARYTSEHLEHLLLIRKWVQAGVSLQAIKQLLEEPDGSKPPIPEPAAGDISVISKIHLAPGLSLEVDAARVGLDQTTLRRLAKTVLLELNKLQGE